MQLREKALKLLSEEVPPLYETICGEIIDGDAVNEITHALKGVFIQAMRNIVSRKSDMGIYYPDNVTTVLAITLLEEELTVLLQSMIEKLDLAGNAPKFAWSAMILAMMRFEEYFLECTPPTRQLF